MGLEKRCVSLSFKSFAGPPFVVFVGLLLVRLHLRRRRGLQSCVLVVQLLLFWLAVVVKIGVVGLVGCLSLLLTKSPSSESHFKPSCAVVSQVGCMYELISHLLAGHP